MSSGATSKRFLTTSRDGDPTSTLGSLCQGLTTPSVNKYLEDKRNRTAYHLYPEHRWITIITQNNSIIFSVPYFCSKCLTFYKLMLCNIINSNILLLSGDGQHSFSSCRKPGELPPGFTSLLTTQSCMMASCKLLTSALQSHGLCHLPAHLFFR